MVGPSLAQARNTVVSAFGEALHWYFEPLRWIYVATEQLRRSVVGSLLGRTAGLAEMVTSIPTDELQLATSTQATDTARERPPASAESVVEEPFVGTSAAIRKLVEDIDRVAGSDTSVLITGEAGTGKTTAALMVHEVSRRRGQTYRELASGPLSLELLESAVLGSERNAGSGAALHEPGQVEQVSATVVLEDIDELSLELQRAVVEILQKRQLKPVRGTQPVDIRVIATTRRDLAPLVEAGEFRRDLFQQLAAARIQMPPLRERGEDIPLLARYLVAKYARARNRPSIPIPEPVLEELRVRAWPGNVRELASVLERSLTLSGGSELELAPQEHVPPGRSTRTTLEESSIQTRDRPGRK
jgi:DNA-binding NtrC family response regulator